MSIEWKELLRKALRKVFWDDREALAHVIVKAEGDNFLVGFEGEGGAPHTVVLIKHEGVAGGQHKYSVFVGDGVAEARFREMSEEGVPIYEETVEEPAGGHQVLNFSTDVKLHAAEKYNREVYIGYVENGKFTPIVEVLAAEYEFEKSTEPWVDDYVNIEIQIRVWDKDGQVVNEAVCYRDERGWECY